jgi:hypothetical protein
MGADAITPTGLITTDLPCAQCDYNLRTQPADGRCPECGHGVAASADAFRRRDIVDFSHVFSGAMILFVALALVPAMQWIQPWLRTRLDNMNFWMVNACVPMVSEIVIVYGVWTLVRARRPKTPARRLRDRAAVAAATALAMLRFATTAAILYTSYGRIHMAVLTWNRQLWALIMSVATLYLLFNGIVFIAGLARRGRRAPVAAVVALATLPSIYVYGYGCLAAWVGVLEARGSVAQTIALGYYGLRAEFQTIITWTTHITLALLWLTVAIIAWRADRRTRNIAP